MCDVVCVCFVFVVCVLCVSLVFLCVWGERVFV